MGWETSCRNMIECKKCQGNCCSLPVFDIKIFEKHQQIAQEITKVTSFKNSSEVVINTSDNMCAFLDRKDYHCLIYEDRPEVCKNYGIIETLPCPFIKPNGNPRSEAGCKHWQRLINHDVDRKIKYLQKKHKGDELK